MIEGDRLLVGGRVGDELNVEVLRSRFRGMLIAVHVAPKRNAEIHPGCTCRPSPRRIP